MYLNGEGGLEKNDVLGLRLIEEAANHDYVHACAKMAEILMGIFITYLDVAKKEPIKADWGKIVSYITKASAKNHPLGLYYFAKILKTGVAGTAANCQLALTVYLQFNNTEF